MREKFTGAEFYAMSEEQLLVIWNFYCDITGNSDWAVYENLVPMDRTADYNPADKYYVISDNFNLSFNNLANSIDIVGLTKWANRTMINNQ